MSPEFVPASNAEIAEAIGFERDILDPSGLTAPPAWIKTARVVLTLAADRDRLAAELARVRRNHLRRMLYIAEWLRNMEHFGSQKEKRYSRLLKRIRAALAQPQDGTTEGQA